MPASEPQPQQPPPGPSSSSASSSQQPQPTLPTRLRTLFTIPPPLRILFDSVPLLTYPPTPLPARSPTPSPLPTLHIFTLPSAPTTAPSPNPTCLKWQTALRLANLPHTVVASTNHASPTGSLPFLLPPTTTTTTTTTPATTTSPSTPPPQQPPLPIPPANLLAYSTKHGHPLPALPTSPKAPVYTALLSDAIRPAWLHAVYLTPRNASLPHRLYLTPATSSSLVQASLGYTLRRAAAEQLRLAAPIGSAAAATAGAVDVDDVYARAAAAFEAFARALEGREWVLGGEGEGPTLLDAELFAYTHLLLDEGLGWKDGRLGREVRRWKALVDHRERVFWRCWEME